jgi:Tol biopolymer transport system component
VLGLYALAQPTPEVPTLAATSPALTQEPAFFYTPSTATAAPVRAPTVTPTFSPQITTTPIGGGPGQLAFSSNRTGAFQIWLMNADGTGLVQLTKVSNGACQPAWSPNGDRMVFVSPCQPRNDTYPGGRLYVMNADGNELKPLNIPVNLEGDYDPKWSPDGKHILYTSVQSGRPQIFEYTFEGSNVRNLSNSRSFDFNPAYSPNGKYIAFVRQITTNNVFIMSDKGENQVQLNLSDPVLTSTSPAWTLDSQLILFSQAKSNLPIPWLMAQRLRDQGTNQELRIPPTGQDVGPVSGISISPDGFLIAYESWPDGKNHDIYLMTINGAGRIQLTTDPGYDFSPAWRPSRTSP